MGHFQVNFSRAHLGPEHYISVNRYPVTGSMIWCSDVYYDVVGVALPLFEDLECNIIRICCFQIFNLALCSSACSKVPGTQINTRDIMILPVACWDRSEHSDQEPTRGKRSCKTRNEWHMIC